MEGVQEIPSFKYEDEILGKKETDACCSNAQHIALNTWVSFCMADLYSELDSLVNGLKLISHRWLCRMYLHHRQNVTCQL